MLRTFPFHQVRPLMVRVSLIAAAVVATGSFDSTSGRLIGTAFLFAFFALCSWCDADVSGTFALSSFAVSAHLFLTGIIGVSSRDTRDRGSQASVADIPVSTWSHLVARVSDAVRTDTTVPLNDEVVGFRRN